MDSFGIGMIASVKYAALSFGISRGKDDWDEFGG